MSANRRTVDFGIDLGTTNSSIAVMEHGEVRVLKNFKQNDITPSAVRIDESGHIIIGQNAYGRLFADSENTSSGFKLLMGTRQAKSFSRSGRLMRPEELSAEILKDLKATVRLRMPEEPELTAAVITVPCYFEMTQSQATTRAAHMAGIEFAPLLQEPIAASIAYGFMEKMPKGYWIVYDFGGGTFDVALLSSREGHLVVLDHDGDNFLGGNDFDWHIVEEIIYPALSAQYDLPQLGRTPTYGLLNAVLKSAAEEAKIALSQVEKTEIIVEPMENLRDGTGRAVSLRLPFDRRQLNLVIENDVDKSLRLFKQVLKNQKLSAPDIGHLILVGGPTQIPYVRERLKNEFNIPVNYGIDPMTVVARGAAIYASTQLLPAGHSGGDDGTVTLELKYEPMTTAKEAMVAGKIIASGSKQLPDGIKVQVISKKGDWQSGMVETKGQAFFLPVFLRENQINTFQVAIFDSEGQRIPFHGDTFSIHQGMSVGAPPLARSIGIELHDGSFDRLLARGVSLPVKASYKYRAARNIDPGREDQAIEIPVREGESDRFDQNRHLGSLVIRGSDVGRRIPINAEVEVTVFVDQNRCVSAEAFIPVLEQKFTMKIPNMTSPLPDPYDFPVVLSAEEKRWKEIQGKAQALSCSLDEIAASIAAGFEEMRRQIPAALGGDAVAIEKTDRRFKELRDHIDAAEKIIFWPSLLRDLRERSADTEDTVSGWGKDGAYSERLSLLKKDAQKAVEFKDARRLAKVLEDMAELKWEILFRQKDFWTGAFQEMRQKAISVFTDPARAQALLDEGARALARKDTESVQSITIELWKLMSKSHQEDISRAVNSRSGIKKKN